MGDLAERERRPPGLDALGGPGHGRPLELYDPGRDANEQPQTIRWTAYDVQPANGTSVTLEQAHPSAHHVVGVDQFWAAAQRLGLGD